MPSKAKSQIKPKIRKGQKINRDNERALKTMAKGAGVVFIGMFIGHFLGYITRLIIARWLGPSDYGLYSLGLAIISMCVLISLLGLPDGVTRYISFFKARKDLGKVKGIIYSAIKCSLLLSVILSFLIYIFSIQISFFFHNSDLISILKVFSVIIPFSVLFTIFIASLRGFKKTKYKVYSQDIFYPISKIIFISFFLYIGLNLFGAAMGYVLSTITFFILALFYLNKTFPIFSSIKSKPITKELLLFSMPILFNTLLATIMGFTDTIMLGFFNNSVDVGIYNIAIPTGSIILFSQVSFSFLFLPIISEFYSKGKNIKKIYKTVTRWIFAFNLPIFLLMFFFPRTIINILFGPEYIAAAYPLLILAVGYFTCFLVMSVDVLTSIKKTKINLLITSIGALSNFVLNLILIPIYGILGAAVATTLSNILLNITLATFSYHYIKIHQFSLNMVKPLISSLISIIFFYSIYRYFSLEEWMLLPLFIGFLLLYAFLFLVLRGLTKEDIIILKSIERKTDLEIGWLKRLIKRFI